MSIAAAIKRMLSAGFDIEQALMAAEIFEEEVTFRKNGSERSKHAEAQARYVEKKRSEMITDDHDDHDDHEQTPSEVSPKNNIKPLPTIPRSSLRSELSSARAEEIFETEFWPAYPKRDGSNPKQPAKVKFVAHLKSGIDPAEIVAGVKAYSIFMANDEPRFVMQATRFLNQKCWQDDYSARAQGAPQPRGSPSPKRLTEVDYLLAFAEKCDRMNGKPEPEKHGEYRSDESEITLASSEYREGPGH